MPVFVNAVAFAVAVSNITVAGADVNGMPQVCISCRRHSEKRFEIL